MATDSYLCVYIYNGVMFFSVFFFAVFLYMQYCASYASGSSSFSCFSFALTFRLFLDSSYQHVKDVVERVIIDGDLRCNVCSFFIANLFLPPLASFDTDPSPSPPHILSSQFHHQLTCSAIEGSNSVPTHAKVFPTLSISIPRPLHSHP